jgi:hypothetical protein
VDDDARAQLVDRLATAVEAIEDRLDTVQESLALLAARVGLGARPVVEEAAPPATDADWVTWLVETYGLAETIPACWEQHAPIVEELKALNIAWAGANDPIDGRAPDLLLWHESLQRCVGRIREWDRAKCRTRGHAA